MASRESQGYLIAVIFLTVLLIVFSVISFLMFSRSNEYADQVAAAKAETAQVRKESEARWALANISMTYAGVPNTSFGEVAAFKQTIASSGDIQTQTQLQTVDTLYEASMAQQIATGDETTELKTYKDVIQNLKDVVGDKHHDVSVQQNRYKNLEIETAKTIKTKDEELKKAQTEKAQLQTEFDEAKKAYATNLRDLEAADAENKAQILEAKQALDKKITDFNTMQKTLNDQKNVLAEDNRKLKLRIEQLTSTNNSIPDGRVIKVNKQGQYVHVNLGELDGLKIKQNFTVYDRDETNFETAETKAKIEIISITGPHMAVARIHERKIGNPILADDHILSPTWDPGYKVPIAVSGMIDLDGDGKSDRLRFEGLVRQNGGVIVAQHDEAGNRRGEINSSTRFLVVGESKAADPNDLGKVMDSISHFDRQAKEFNVQKISVRRFLNLMGVQLRGQVESLDKFIGTEPKQKFQPRSAFDK